MDKFQRNKKFLNQPKYPGGSSAMQDFIRKNLVYPPLAIARRTQGTVQVKYTIGKNGIVTVAKVISKVGDGCDEEAVRLVKLLKFDMPKNRGVKTLFHRSLNINFKLAPPKEVKTTDNSAIQYHYKEEKKTGASYNYTVEL